METINFLTAKMEEQINLKAIYSSKKNLAYFEEISLKEIVKEIEMYVDAIATIKAFNKITSTNLLATA